MEIDFTLSEAKLEILKSRSGYFAALYNCHEKPPFKDLESEEFLNISIPTEIFNTDHFEAALKILSTPWPTAPSADLNPIKMYQLDCIWMQNFYKIWH